MQVDRTRFLAEGYLVLRGVIPSAELEGLRQSYGTLVERQRAISARERQADEPPGGQWEMTAQPRLILSQMNGAIDRETITAVEIWLHDHIYGISADLLGVEDPGVVEMMMLCNPSRDWGTGGHNGWHRDVYPPFGAPIQGYTDDIIENGPRYVQWNIPLYDDDVLWVLPRSAPQPNQAGHHRSDKASHPRRKPAPIKLPKLSDGERGTVEPPTDDASCTYQTKKTKKTGIRPQDAVITHEALRHTKR